MLRRAKAKSHQEGAAKHNHPRESSMKRRDFIKVTGLGAVGAAAVAAPAIAQSMPEIKWRMPTSWPKSLDTLYGGAEMMAKMVGEATDNKFQIQSFAGGEIVPGLQVLGAVLNGIEHLQARNDFATGECLNLEFIVGGLADHLGHHLGAAIQRVQRFRPAG